MLRGGPVEMNPSSFYNTYLPLAQDVSRRTGLDPRLVLAQAALESGWGKGAAGGNFFGIKSHGRPNGQTLVTTEYQGGQYVPQEASFRTYDRPEQSFYDYGSFILDNPRYRAVMDAGSLQDQIAAMGASGYATDPEYSRKLSGIVEMFGADGGNMESIAQHGLLGPQPRPGDRRRDIAGALASGFNMLRRNPNQNLDASIAHQRQQRQSNRTADWLRSQPGGEIYAQMADMGRGAEGLAAYQAATTAAANPNVQSSKTLPDLSGTVMTMRDGSVRVVTAGGETLTGQEALDFVRASQEANVGYQQDIYGARRFGTLSADLTLGGEAAQETEEGKQRVKWAGDALADARVVQSSIVNINDAIRAIDEGAEAGMVYNMLPNITVASASLKNAMDKMGLDVIGSVTFGALSEAEMKLAMETAVPRNLDEVELREWLSDKLVAQQKAQAALIETAAHFAGGGSQADYIAKYKSVTSEAQTADRQATHRFNPETGQVEEVK